MCEGGKGTKVGRHMVPLSAGSSIQEIKLVECPVAESVPVLVKTYNNEND